MAITSPNSLWKGYDVSALPLNETALADKTRNGVCIREFYFDGLVTVDGRVRSFIRFYENPQAKGVVLYMGNREGNGDDGLITEMYELGYTVGELDYLGTSFTNPRFTFYPQSLASCNCLGATSFDAPDDPLTSNWYVWTCMARRAILLIKNHYENKKIFALGKGLGGSTIFKLAALEEDVTACATVLNILPKIKGSGDSMILYRAALDAVSYAPLTKQPLFIAVSSNDEDASLDHMSELASNTASLKYLRIVERAFSAGITPAYANIDAFFDECAANKPHIPRPTITAANSENKLYLNIKLDNPAPTAETSVTVENVKLYTSFYIENPAQRNWNNSKLLGVGDGCYMSRVDVLRTEKPTFAFVNVSYSNGLVQSSQPLVVIPKTLGIPSQPTIWQRLIYDGSMGKDVWTSPSGGTVSSVEGPFGIEGITCDTHSLATFKVVDPLFRAPSGTLLQLLISGSPQTINITLVDEDDYYTCKIDIPSAGAWHKFTLSNLDFKGINGPLPDWSRMIMLRFVAENDFIVSSVLWV